MMKLWMKIKETFLTRNFIVFVIIGLFNTFNGTLVSYILSLCLQPNIAFVIGYMISLGIAYILNSAFNFKQKMTFVKFVKFSVSYIPNFIIQNITVIVVYNVLGLHKLIAYALAAIIGIPVTFLFLKFYAFAKKPEGKKYSSETITEWLNRHSMLVTLLVFVFFVIFAFASNWSIVLGENLMKWDIWDAEYPNEVLLTDALANDTFPVWNPLMHYGTPNYASFGTPVWYPVTILLAFIGYTPSVLGVSYAIHLAIAGFGMYLFAKQEVQRQKQTVSATEICASFAAGILYCGSGVFLSNAQHIMIIISAAWIPYAFYFFRRFLVTKRLLFAMSAGVCAGLIWLGGYPELFYNTFLFLIPYTVYFYYNKSWSFLKNIFESAKKYLLICIFTICSCAISLIPVLMNIGNTTRTNGLGKETQDYSLTTFLSFLFPKVSEIVDNVEGSMINYYMGVIVIVLLPMVFHKKYKNRLLYMVLAGIALFLCMGSQSPLHAFLYRFFPMYTMFRFATTSRIFVALFCIVLTANAIRDILNGDISIKTMKLTKYLTLILFLVTVVVSIIDTVFSGMLDETTMMKCDTFAYSAWVAFIFVFLYFVLFYLVQSKSCGKAIKVVVVGLICIEVATYIYLETPITIAQYEPEMYTHDYAVQTSIEDIKRENKNRNHTVNFANQARSNSELNSQKIVYNKTFDEDGYLSFIYDNIENYKLSYNNSIIKQNPEAYFTNDVVTSEDVDYAAWSSDCSVPPEQIYVEKGLDAIPSKTINFQNKLVKEKNLNVVVSDTGMTISANSGTMSSGKLETGRIRVILKNSVSQEKIQVRNTFIDENNNSYSYSGNYKVYQEQGKKYIDIYYPTSELNYVSLSSSLTNNEVESAKQVVVERMKNDGIVDIISFGFNGLDMKVNNDCEGYVTLLQMYHYGWKAYVDGKEVDISKVNNCFIGIHLDTGSHDITLKFRPNDLFIGAGITGIFYIVLCTLWFLYILRKRNLN